MQEQTLRDLVTKPRGRTRSIVVAPEVNQGKTTNIRFVGGGGQGGRGELFRCSCRFVLPPPQNAKK